ncbi:Arm DNA-binding domain-containing protein [Limibaculum sp. FT325]|uniref:integrase arm-type DNA-binding domain-containing protein n=1 Tax=Thermohalobaculum sediminis TaxID=2939436 RepID=UPI0020BDBD2C|nr:integrase arm-type DNA-binding domain-containing protein [Limibaculum sediminis]MCL5778341.1 Arm DNA-binding domain-containing protein [Limibaculum sediminis]
MPSLRLTRKSVDALPLTTAGQEFYRDDILRGFGVRVGTRSKVFFAEGQVDRQTKRVSIGRADVIAVDVARKRALGLLSAMAAGRDPSADRRALRS